MNSGPSRGTVGILCRDFGFLPQATGGFRRVEIKINDAHQRKGNQKYANALISQLEDWHTQWFKEIVVVGDGEGDILFCNKLNTLLKTASRPIQISGLFFRNPSLERFQDETVTLFDDWKSLSGTLTNLLSDRARKFDSPDRMLLLIDVDRTILFPRSIFDELYLETRSGVMVDYVTSFRTDNTGSRFDGEICKSVDMVTAHLKEYTDHEFNDLCFKNEETVALGTLMHALGTIRDDWIVRAPDWMTLDWHLTNSIHAVDRGKWISNLDLKESGAEAIISGETVWNAEMVLQHLRRSRSRLRENKPVLSRRFREIESRRLSAVIAEHGINIFNSPLLECLRTATPCPTLFVTDRPARSLGISPDKFNYEPDRGIFWKELTRFLYRHGTTHHQSIRKL